MHMYNSHIPFSHDHPLSDFYLWLKALSLGSRPSLWSSLVLVHFVKTSITLSLQYFHLQSQTPTSGRPPPGIIETTVFANCNHKGVLLCTKLHLLKTGRLAKKSLTTSYRKIVWQVVVASSLSAIFLLAVSNSNFRSTSPGIKSRPQSSSTATRREVSCACAIN